jgi:protease-4
MSTFPADVPPPPPDHRPTRPPQPPPAPASGLFGCFFGLSLLLNFLALSALFIVCLGASLSGSLSDDSRAYPETYHTGNKKAGDKVAIVNVEGVLFEGLLTYAHKQIDMAAKDDKVKAVVLRVNSPGGSVTASEDLHRRLIRLRDGDEDKGYSAKPLVVSMGSLAASGGYYIAVPGKKLFAEKTTTTGSIGVYLALPNAAKLGREYGFAMNTFKAGEIKAAGSLFHELSEKEKLVLQDMVDESYVQFLDIVEEGRPKLTRGIMLERFEVKPLRPDPLTATGKAEPYTRYRADGGTFTGQKALDLGLVDAIGTLEDAIKFAADQAELDEYKAVKYSKPQSLTGLLTGKAEVPALPDLERLEASLTPRLWYLAPGHEAAALAAAARAAK